MTAAAGGGGGGLGRGMCRHTREGGGGLAIGGARSSPKPGAASAALVEWWNGAGLHILQQSERGNKKWMTVGCEVSWHLSRENEAV